MWKRPGKPGRNRRCRRSDGSAGRTWTEMPDMTSTCLTSYLLHLGLAGGGKRTSGAASSAPGFRTCTKARCRVLGLGPALAAQDGRRGRAGRPLSFRQARWLRNPLMIVLGTMAVISVRSWGEQFHGGGKSRSDVFLFLSGAELLCPSLQPAGPVWLGGTHAIIWTGGLRRDGRGGVRQAGRRSGSPAGAASRRDPRVPDGEAT